MLKYFLSRLGYEIRKIQPQRPRFQSIFAMNPSTVIDVGANVGQFARSIRDFLPGAMIYSFEPLADCCKQLAAHFKNDPKFEAFCLALGDRSEERSMHRSAYSCSSSLLPMLDLHKNSFPESASSTIESVTVKRLDDVMRGKSLQPPVLLKLDVQGYEDIVVQGGLETVSRCQGVLVEASTTRLYEGQPLFDDIYRLFRRLGFSYRGNVGQLLSPLDGSILQVDAFFIREGLVNQ